MYWDPSGHLSTDQQTAIDEINAKLETTTNAGEREGLLYGIWRIESGLSCLGTATGYTDTNTNTWVIEGGGTVAVGSDANFYNINISGDSNITVNDNATANTINVEAGSNTYISDYGTIGNLNIGGFSTTSLFGSGYTNMINSGPYSSTYIYGGTVGTFNTGYKSTNLINSYVNILNTGEGNHTYIGAGFTVGDVGKGKVLSLNKDSENLGLLDPIIWLWNHSQSEQKRMRVERNTELALQVIDNLAKEGYSINSSNFYSLVLREMDAIQLEELTMNVAQMSGGLQIANEGRALPEEMGF